MVGVVAFITCATLLFVGVKAQVLTATDAVGTVTQSTVAATTTTDTTNTPLMPVDADGVPLCSQKWNLTSSIPLKSINLCSQDCEQRLYFSEYLDYQKCHSCCGQRLQAYLATRRTSEDCQMVDGKVCNGRGTCIGKGQCACEPLWGGPSCTDAKEYGFCHVVGDPHFRSLDGLRFNVNTQGQYLLYSNPEDVSSEAVVVNLVAYYKATVSRGVMVRYMNEIVSVDHPFAISVDCTDATSKLVAGLMTTPSGVNVKVEAFLTTITTPNGLTVYVQSNAWGQNVWTRVFAARNGQCIGLCGNFDGQAANDNGFPALVSRQEPIPQVLRAVQVPETSDFSKCTKGSYAENFPAAHLETIDFSSQEVLNVIAANQRAVDIKLSREVEKRLSDNLADRLRLVYQDGCAGNRRSQAEKACWRLLDNKAVRAFVDCVADQCESGEAAFVDAASNAAAQDLIIKQSIVNDRLKMSKLQFEAEAKK